MTAPAPHSETFVARIACDRLAAHHLADALAEGLDPEISAVSLFEDGERWTVEAAFHDDADRTLISGIVARVAEPSQATALPHKIPRAGSTSGLVGRGDSGGGVEACRPIGRIFHFRQQG